MIIIFRSILFLIIYFFIGFCVSIFLAVFAEDFYSKDDDGDEVISVMVFWPLLVFQFAVLLILSILDVIFWAMVNLIRGGEE